MTRLQKTSAVLVGLVFCIFFSAQPAVSAGTCVSDTSCSAGERCLSNGSRGAQSTCVRVCSSSAQCGAGFTCQTSIYGSNLVCVDTGVPRSVGESCSASRGCQTGLECVSLNNRNSAMECKRSCTADSECASLGQNYACIDAPSVPGSNKYCTYSPPNTQGMYGSSCVQDVDCLVGYLCLTEANSRGGFKKCFLPCVADTDCSQGFSCVLPEYIVENRSVCLPNGIGTTLLQQTQQVSSSTPGYEPIAWSFPTDKINSLNKVGISGTGTAQVQLLIGRLIRYAVGFLGALALCLVIYSGLRFMLSQGDEEKQGEALKMMLWSGIGIVALLGSYSMVTFVLNVLR